MKRMLGETLAVAVAALGLLASCSSSTSESSGSATVTGTINSTAFSFASGFAVISPMPSVSCQEHIPDGGRTPCQVVAVILTNRSDLTCDALISDQTPGHVVSYANRDALAISVLLNSGTVPPGPYNADGTYETTTATCGNGPAYQSTDGSSFTLIQLSATEVAGSFSMNFGTQGSLSGSFDLPICNVPDAGSQTSGADASATCTP